VAHSAKFSPRDDTCLFPSLRRGADQTKGMSREREDGMDEMQRSILSYPWYGHCLCLSLWWCTCMCIRSFDGYMLYYQLSLAGAGRDDASQR